MARKPQGIMSVAPGLVDQIIGPDQRKGLFGNIYDQSDFLSRKEFASPGSIAAAKLGKSGTVKEGIRDILKDPYRMGTNVISNIPSVFKGIGAFLDEKSDQGRLDQAAETAANMSGEVFGLPTDKTGLGSVVPKGLYDAFDTLDGGQGQERLVDTQFPDGISIQDVINNADKGTTDGTDGVVDTSFDSDYDADLAESTGATDGSGENLTAAQTATKTALSEFLAQARPGVKPQKYDEYIKEFGDATGLDISGEPDTKQALMSFGLALMQNRAGKGFDISKILTATGEAGEAAMPDFRKAVAESKAVRAKAGEYALGKTKEDKNAAMNRKNYFIVPKGKGGIKGIISNFDKGEFQPLNSYELNSLQENLKFNEQYDIVPSSVYSKYTEALLKTPELGKKYLNKTAKMQLFEGAKGTVFDIPVQYTDSNYKGTDGAKKPAFKGDYDNVMNGFKGMRRDIDKAKSEFKSLMTAIAAPGGVTVWKQGLDNLTNLGAALGIPVSKDQTSTQKIDLILNRIQAKYAPQILGEAGKTISDGDRARVAQIVGDLSLFQNPADLEAAISMIFKDIIGSQENKLIDGLKSFNSLTGKKLNFESGGSLNEEQKKRLAEYEARRK